MSPRSFGERREVPLALLVERVEIVDVQPLAGELGRQPPRSAGPSHIRRAWAASTSGSRAAVPPRPLRAARRRASTTRGNSSSRLASSQSVTGRRLLRPAAAFRAGTETPATRARGPAQADRLVVRQLFVRAACDKARAARCVSARRQRPAIGLRGEGDQPRRAAAARSSTSSRRNAAARSLIGLRIGSKTLGSASCVAYSMSC